MTTDTATKLSLIDLLLLADPIAHHLGDGWTRCDEEADSKTLRFTHHDGRHIGFRYQFGGLSAQTFAADPNQATGGYNAAVTFAGSTGSPLEQIMTTLETRLIPGAFHATRPQLRADGTPHPPAAEADTATSAPKERPSTVEKPPTPAATAAQPEPGRTKSKPTAARRAAKKPTAAKPKPASTKAAAKRPTRKASSSARVASATTQPKAPASA
ncbi:hypothetical protein ACGFRG_05835 [Streptomyces sp. NPDC048696]|uniref:hypothetical protein n=1 Tax=Streptomyces sp. NPDC048696 TaxID=3365585 RepID=UPI003712634A